MGDGHLGTTINADLECLLRAGKDWLPEQARKLARVAEQLSTLTATLDRQSAAAQDPPALRSALAVNDDLARAFHRGVHSLDEGARLVLEAAARFAKTDNDAAQEMQHLQHRLPGLVSMPAPAAASAPPPSNAAAPGSSFVGPIPSPPGTPS